MSPEVTVPADLDSDAASAGEDAEEAEEGEEDEGTQEADVEDDDSESSEYNGSDRVHSPAYQHGGRQGAGVVAG